ncbi:Pol polyprotein [Abeliophyllum distichum]|uniref:Pol polyprotein n=1 Tax=Abeliophyllum distichum TaxID=126358 RepID=A0ABD1Q8G6_9LAMI
MRQVPEICHCAQASGSEPHPSHQSMAFCQMENRFQRTPSYEKGRCQFTVVVVDYFTKWCEAEPLAKIMDDNTWKFVWKNIVCLFRITHSLVLDNSTQFTVNKFNSNYEELRIQMDFSSMTDSVQVP